MKFAMALPNAIIAGTNKSGTTSLFRYLSDHPDVCASSIKEITFFSRLDGEITPQVLSEYATYFAHCSPGVRIRLEASPNYLSGGTRVAKLIRGCLPDAKLIFVLREPVSRLLSNFHRRKERLHEKIGSVSLNEYIQSLLQAAENEDGSDSHNAFSWDLKSVVYADLISQYLAVSPSSQIKIMFFDDLTRSARDFVKSACAFLGIEQSFYDAYEFHVENKTRSYKSKRLQKLAYQINMRFESSLNRIPAARRWLRGVYNMINEKPNVATQSAYDGTEQLRAYFHDHNRALGNLLRETYPGIPLPEWIPE